LENLANMREIYRVTYSGQSRRNLLEKKEIIYKNLKVDCGIFSNGDRRIIYSFVINFKFITLLFLLLQAILKVTVSILMNLLYMTDN